MSKTANRTAIKTRISPYSTYRRLLAALHLRPRFEYPHLKQDDLPSSLDELPAFADGDDPLSPEDSEAFEKAADMLFSRHELTRSEFNELVRRAEANRRDMAKTLSASGTSQIFPMKSDSKCLSAAISDAPCYMPSCRLLTSADAEDALRRCRPEIDAHLWFWLDEAKTSPDVSADLAAKCMLSLVARRAFRDFEGADQKDMLTRQDAAATAFRLMGAIRSNGKPDLDRFCVDWEGILSVIMTAYDPKKFAIMTYLGSGVWMVERSGTVIATKLFDALSSGLLEQFGDVQACERFAIHKIAIDEDVPLEDILV